MKPTRLARRLWTLTAIRRCMAAALRYNRTAVRLRTDGRFDLELARREFAEIRGWCLAQLNRFTMQEVAA